ncbi:cytochrome-c oxidase, cbb3-type subunit III [Sulfitobacter sp. SK012]|uniref:cytochrome-c oxidase, cbb3-type subunit III n=1 Tax=Sulfitobacter sp. SK012 TaxID=1389005 RepID=UPI000E0A2946|nr:cytochrome-c oxidase, cbb3-type subunit III [Sulfitobacter sp. SK012]AXI48589.1 cytochrome-c oxidase, cbb3-type subunit III [Sulfitobacter sp. SK012]
MSVKDKDPISGTDMTGHEWDGIKELDTPVPWAARWALWISIAVAVLFWVLYPSFPYATDYARGFLGYSSRTAVNEAVAAAEAERAENFAPFATDDIVALAADPTLEELYSAPISKLYADNCAACHRNDLAGQEGFPNLTDAHWLWSGAPEEIEYAIRYGINADNDDALVSQMLAFGADEILEKPEINDVTDFVMSLSGRGEDVAAVARGQIVYEDNCASCHGDDGRGGLEVGAPDLGDDQWIYGADREQIYQSIYAGRQGVMPAWDGRLTDEQIRMLTLYVLWAGEDGGS